MEVGGFFWNPAPTIKIRSEGLTEARLGSEIDFVNELGLEQQNFRQLKVVLRPATKHKFRFEFTPINYDNPAATISRDLVFNGQLYRLSIPVATEMRWNAYRFAYEWDMVYTSRGFFGIILEAKYTDVEARLSQGLEKSESDGKINVDAWPDAVLVSWLPDPTVAVDFEVEAVDACVCLWGEIDLDVLTEKVERAAALLAICRQKLAATETKVKKVTADLTAAMEQSGADDEKETP